MTKTLGEEQLMALKESLLFLHVKELQDIATKLALPAKDKKADLINRIIQFLATGEIIPEATVPAASCAQPGQKYPLAPKTLMLKGAYKNDLVTRLFLIKLIGKSFHFTAFGLDWLNERWMAGRPPTYEEFAKMWIHENQRRQKFGSPLKEEWALLNFVKMYSAENPEVEREVVIAKWNAERRRNVNMVNKILKDVLK